MDDEENVPKPVIRDVYKMNESTVCVTFTDNTKWNFNSLWLRDSCTCPSCVHPVTQQKMVSSVKIDPNIQPISWNVEDGEKLEVVWPQSGKLPPHSSTYSCDWLYNFGKILEAKAGEGEEVPDAFYTNTKSSTILWHKEEIDENPPELDFETFMNDRAGLKQMVKNVVKYGISVLHGVPAHEEELQKVANRMGYIRETGLGRIFDATCKPDAHRGSRFMQHTELPDRDSAPGVKLLLCLSANVPKPTLEGTPDRGKTFFVDGFYVAQWMKYNHPEYFRLLVTTPVTFSYYDSRRKVWLRDTFPIIRTNRYGKVTKIHYSTFSMRPPLLSPSEATKFYEAYGMFTKRMEQESSQYSFYMAPGDLVAFNNRRILHGMKEQDPNQPDIILRGCYMDMDEISSLFEKMRRDDDF
uniref:Putative gamma-butyrobetaine2-oxoglutarate dioxygenase n=2 Tax=Ornithodoros turicata TaxID=34597 RepID=A0A2R5LMU5_9ACAR